MHPRTWDGVQCVGRSHGSFPASTALQLRASRNKTISIIFVMKGKKQVCSPKSLLENTKIRERSETMVKSFEIHSSFWHHKNTFWYTFSKCILSLKEKFTVLIMCILSSKKQYTEKKWERKLLLAMIHVTDPQGWGMGWWADIDNCWWNTTSHSLPHNPLIKTHPLFISLLTLTQHTLAWGHCTIVPTFLFGDGAAGMLLLL